MKNTLGNPLLFILMTLLVTACATPLVPMPTIETQPIDGGQYTPKANHLVFIMDASSSMLEGYQGHQKLDIARAVVGGFNETMPEMDIEAALHTFGHADSVSSKNTETLLPSQRYSRSALASAIERVTAAGGISPLERSINDAASDLTQVNAPIAMIIISDGEDMGSAPVSAAQALADAHGDRLCIYTVQAGNASDGKTLLEKIAAVTDCGDALAADTLGSSAGMNGFVKEVLLAAKMDSDGDGVADDQDRCPNTPAGVKVTMQGCQLDSDKDGVVDGKDNCPNTPAGVRVDDTGCPVPVASKSAEVTAAGTWIYKDIQFENNKAELKKGSFDTLNEITAALKAQPGLNIEIQGHTDSSGARDYNMGLSERRAQSVKTFLESKGIVPARMTTRGYGPDRPITSNATKDGRARNRRVEIKPIQ